MALSCLTQRRFIRLSGEVCPFLQGIVTQDVMQMTSQNPSCLYSLMLTPQGKFFCDFFLWTRDDGSVVIDIDETFMEGLLKKLSQFNLRKQVIIEDVSDQFRTVVQFPGEGSEDVTLLVAEWLPDPRWEGLGNRALVSPSKITDLSLVPEDQYRMFCRSQGVPEGAEDLEVDRSIPLEFNMDELGAFSWTKGCYMGQELMSRIKHRQLLRKRCLIVTGSIPHLDRGTPLFLEGTQAATVVHFQEGVGLAVVSLEAYHKARESGEGLTVGEGPRASSEEGLIFVQKPLWLSQSVLDSFLTSSS